MYLVDGNICETVTDVINHIDDGVGLKNRNETITKLENMVFGERINIELDYTELYLGRKHNVRVKKT